MNESCFYCRRGMHDACISGEVECPCCAPSDGETPVYGMCLGCRSIEVRLIEAAGIRDFSGIGESAEYPTGYGCEVCS